MNSQHAVSGSREIIYEPSYEAALTVIGGGDFFLGDEFVQGVEWLVIRSPQSGRQICDGSPVHYLCGSDTPGLPAITVYYTFNDKAVWFLDVHMS